eukprot:SM000232S07928  [mRNA]  locus=s232:75818:80082:- [translate_table: standard]
MAPAPPTLWLDKHPPVLPRDLAVHHKKKSRRGFTISSDDRWGWAQANRQALLCPLQLLPLHAPASLRLARAFTTSLTVARVHAGCRVLLLTGPPGAGKTVMMGPACPHPCCLRLPARGDSAKCPNPSHHAADVSSSSCCCCSSPSLLQAVVRVLARAEGLEVAEWVTPVPTLWHEHKHRNNSSYAYVSKLDEFQGFLLQATRFPSLCLVPMPPSMEGCQGQASHPATGSAVAKLLLIDDLPLAADNERRQKLRVTLESLARLARFPTVVILTESNTRGSERSEGIADYISALQSGGATKVTFNAVTDKNLVKVLLHISTMEKTSLSQEDASSLAAKSAGDIRHAISALQYWCLCRTPQKNDLWDPGGSYGTRSHQVARGVKRRGRAGARLEDVRSDRRMPTKSAPTTTEAATGRDESLALFHMLGKLLHNKRLPNTDLDDGKQCNLELHEDLRRHALKMQPPEDLLQHTDADFETLSCFLHENIIDFIDEDGAEDLSEILFYISTADCMRTMVGRPSRSERLKSMDNSSTDPAGVAGHAASLVAARGVLFANAHPAPTSFFKIRRPAVWSADVQRQAMLAKVKCSSCGPLALHDLADDHFPHVENLSVWPSAHSAAWERACCGTLCMAVHAEHHALDALEGIPPTDGVPDLPLRPIRPAQQLHTAVEDDRDDMDEDDDIEVF